MLTYKVDRLSSGEVTIDVKLVFRTPQEGIDAMTKIEGMVFEQTIDDELLPFLKDGHLLQAVKYHKEKTGMGLKESKEYCDALRVKFRKMGLIPNE